MNEKERIEELIKQLEAADRVLHWRHDNEWQSHKKIEALEAEVARLRDAIEFIAACDRMGPPPCVICKVTAKEALQATEADHIADGGKMVTDEELEKMAVEAWSQGYKIMETLSMQHYKDWDRCAKPILTALKSVRDRERK